MSVEVRAPSSATDSARAQPGLDSQSVTQELPVTSGHRLALTPSLDVVEDADG